MSKGLAGMSSTMSKIKVSCATMTRTAAAVRQALMRVFGMYVFTSPRQQQPSSNCIEQMRSEM